MELGKRILVTGLTALDIVHDCENHPLEGSTINANRQFWRKGGNAANTVQVLAQLGAKVSLFSVLSKNFIGRFVCNEMSKHGVDLSHCVYSARLDELFPTSICFIARNTGTSSVIHCRNDFQPLEFTDFESNIDCNNFSWFHFEERGCLHLPEILSYISKQKKEAKISIELEKPKRFESVTKKILHSADVIFISKEVARFLGYDSAADTVSKIKADLNLRQEVTVICPWGEAGAAGIDSIDRICYSEAVIPDIVVDTLGAGDTFIAGAIFCLVANKDLQTVIEFACQLAGAKCGSFGFESINSSSS